MRNHELTDNCGFDDLILTVGALFSKTHKGIVLKREVESCRENLKNGIELN